MLTISRLKSVLNYDAATGIFTWCASNRTGRAAGCLSEDGYLRIRIDRILYLAHRLVWFYMNERWPTEYIDHVDRNKTNNRIVNLREANGSQNNANNIKRRNALTSKLKGVRAHRDTYQSYITKNRTFIYLGQFDCPAAAHFAYLIAADHHFGEFARAR